MRLNQSKLCDARSGYTLVELLVALVIISVLVGLVFMGVQAARESARRASCQSNLRQIGLGLANYETTNQILPYGHSRFGFSAHVAILPFVGDQVRFDQFDLTRSESENHENAELGRQSPNLYSCPTSLGPGGPTISYYGNAGTGMYDGPNGSLISNRDHVKRLPVPPTRSAAFIDGTSNTAIMSEVVLNPDTLSNAIARFEPHVIYARDSYAQFARKCYLKQGFSKFEGYKPTWIRGDPGNSRYFHILTPNQMHCSNDGAVQEMIITASSKHPGGVLVLYGDAAIRWTANSVDLSTWRAVGSRDSTESELSVF